MESANPAPRGLVPPSSLAALAERLREGPLQQLVPLQRLLAELTERPADGPTFRVEDLERLVRLSVAVMENFNAFTRELAAVIRDLTDDHPQRH
jgi:hypothetical protein